jgi:hypothetical protein
MKNKVPRVFLAHSSSDHTSVGRIAYDLRRRGIPVWYDEWELKVGDSLHDKIEEGIAGSGYLTVLLSNKSVQSDWVRKELNAALTLELERRDVFVLPALLENCEIPLFLQDKKYADFRTHYSSGLEGLLARLLPEGTLSTMLKGVDSLELELIPAFRNGEKVEDYDLNRVMQAVNSVEIRLGLEPTEFVLMKTGQIVTSDNINQLLAPIERIRREVHLATDWRYHPVSPGVLYTAEHLNEIYGSVNEVTRYILSQ